MWLGRVSDVIWCPWLLGLFLTVGIYCSVATGFFQVRCIYCWIGTTVGRLAKKKSVGRKGALSQTQALATALASTIGTGSIAGVATAIFYGGPGAVFWMWLSAFFSMMTGCLEKILAVHYRQRGEGGGWQGGPMCYISHGMGRPRLALCFSLCCVAASLGGGNMVQANSIATALEASFGWEPLVIGLVVASVTALIIMGGIGRIGRVSEALVPTMALLFLLAGGIVLWCNRDALPQALAEIWEGAFHGSAALGGGLGYSVATAMRYGIARGVFTNEAGMGSSAMAHGAADVSAPGEQGMWGIFEVFISTLLVCSVTALVILTTGVYQSETAQWAMVHGTVTTDMLGAPLSAAAFSTVFGWGGGVLVSICLLLFAFTSLLGWSYYGERGLAHLTGTTRWRYVYRTVFLVMIVVGSVGDLTAVWQLADIFNGLMAIPNLMAIVALSPQAIALLKDWCTQQGRGNKSGFLR